MPRADDEEAVSWAVEATKHGKSAQFDFEKLLADVNNRPDGVGQSSVRAPSGMLRMVRVGFRCQS
jgi:hypothetical protein